MTRWLVTGANGQLGTHLTARLAGTDVVGLARADLDVTDPAAVAHAVREHRPDVVVNAAAYTAVDAAETDEPAALAINGTAPGLLAAALRDTDATLIHVSTDYVFDGRADRPYEADDAVDPQGAYGRTKLAGERAVRDALPDRGHVVRTAWVYGGPGPNFVDTMRRLEGERDTVDVVDDQTGSPTWVGDLAAALVGLGRSGAPAAVRHFVNAGTATWFDLARETFRLVGADPRRVRPTDSAAFARPAPRPAWSVLSTKSWTEAGLIAPRPWREALADALSDAARA